MPSIGDVPLDYAASNNAGERPHFSDGINTTPCFKSVNFEKLVFGNPLIFKETRFGTWFALSNYMPRLPRTIADQGIFHLIARGNNHTKLCKKVEDFLQLKSRLTYYAATYGVAIYHYAIMQTHLHFLAFVEDTKPLSSFFKAFQISYFHYFKKQYSYEGHLWHGRYTSIPILKESHYLQAGRYIELNPIKAKITGHPNSYPWSSYHFYAHGKKDFLITPNPQYLEWGNTDEERQKNYQNFILSDAYFENKILPTSHAA